MEIKMDGGLVLFLVHVLSLLCTSLACMSPEQFNTECLTPFNNYREGADFWQNICSEEGRTIFSCITTQYSGNCEGTTDEEIQSFNSIFEGYEMSIDYACEFQTNAACREVSNCFPDIIYDYTGDTVYSFYEYFCGDKLLQFMFTCSQGLETDCPASVEIWRNGFKLVTPSGLLAFDVLDVKVTTECGKLLSSDVECIRVKDAELATCGIYPDIDIPQGVITCQESDQSWECVTGKCGSTVATFYEEMFSFLQCRLDVDGGWSDWGGWASCSETCGDGTKIRTRACNNPPPSGNGEQCNGTFLEVDGCNEGGCPVDGVFSIWGLWATCSRTCGGGTRMRERSCSSPAPANGGQNCTGDYSQTESCNDQNCPVHGVYGPWGSWGQCAGSCGQGVQTRSRNCDSPSPSDGGSPCSGPSTNDKVCVIGDCPVNGGFGNWEVWSICSKTCGGGEQVRTRACDSPAPANGGNDCSGDRAQTRNCNEQQCQSTSCAEVTDVYGVWPETSIGLTFNLQCQKTEEEGLYTRRCEANGLWGNVTGQCEIKSEIFNELNEQLENLESLDDVAEEVENIAKNLTGLTDNFDSLTSGDTIENVVETAELLVDVVETSKATTEEGSQAFFELMSNLIEPETETAWNGEETDVDGSDVMEMVDRFVTVMQEVECDALNDGEVSSYDNTNLYTEQGKVAGDVRYPVLKQADSYIEIPAETLSNKGLTDVCFGGSSYTSIGNIAENYISIDGTTTSFANGQEVNSEVVSMQLQNVSGVLDPPVRVTLKPKDSTLKNPVCVFMDYNIIGSSGKGAWSSEGCRVVNSSGDKVICECTHLTNFAILMSPSEISDKHSKILSIVSAVGCAISMVCLILTLVVHAMVWKLVRSDRAIILMNLCVALLLALGVFLAGVNRTESEKACAAIAAIIQLLFLAVFFFMLLIGIEILICVVHVFVTKFRIKIFLPVAWLAPVLIVGISLGVTKAEGYGNDRFCWLDIDSGVIWSFIGPVALIILINFIIVLIVFKKMASSAVLKSKSTAMKIQTGARSLCVLLPMMGLTWVFGLLSVNSSFVFFQYLFSICNTLQGLFIFLFHCVLNRQVRDAIKRRRDRRRSLQTLSSDLRKQSRSLSKDGPPKSPTSDPGSSDSSKKGVDNKAFVRRERRARSEDYQPSDWERLERKEFHRKIRRGSKLEY